MFYMCSGDRPLHIAVRQARTDAAILLLSHGADTSAINNLHETAAEVRLLSSIYNPDTVTLSLCYVFIVIIIKG